MGLFHFSGSLNSIGWKRYFSHSAGRVRVLLDTEPKLESISKSTRKMKEERKVWCLNCGIYVCVDNDCIKKIKERYANVITYHFRKNKKTAENLWETRRVHDWEVVISHKLIIFIFIVDKLPRVCVPKLLRLDKIQMGSISTNQAGLTCLDPFDGCKRKRPVDLASKILGKCWQSTWQCGILYDIIYVLF